MRSVTRVSVLLLALLGCKVARDASATSPEDTATGRVAALDGKLRVPPGFKVAAVRG